MGLYLVESIKGANIFGKLAFIFLLIAMFLGWIAYTTANWCRIYITPDDDDYVGYGIWRVADNSEPYSADFFVGTDKYSGRVGEHNDGWLLPWFGAFQAFATFGFISLNVGFFLVVLFIFVGPCKSNKDMGFWNAINCIFGSICWLIAIILFAAYFEDFDKKPQFDEPNVSYSFVFAIFTFALQLATGIVLLLTNRGGGAVAQDRK
ncbi:hypothetical protein BaRGS_00009588 [Batillaria attramentaria]|uniref:Uncharacterized protein n=1 Tax=Batillaria attramentaria TaxID=370345 RepID=A0ABD0LIC8_9CAEN